MIHAIMSGHGGDMDHQQPDYKQHTFESGRTVYEGIENRKIKQAAIELGRASGLKLVDANPLPDDFSRSRRITMVNNIHATEKCILYEIHNNASRTHTASGFEVFTTRLDNASDIIADIMIEELEKIWPGLRNRGHKEKDFDIIKGVRCYGILIEFCFFDYLPDVDRVLNPQGYRLCAQALVNTMQKVEEMPIYENVV